MASALYDAGRLKKLEECCADCDGAGQCQSSSSTGACSDYESAEHWDDELPQIFCMAKELLAGFSTCEFQEQLWTGGETQEQERDRLLLTVQREVLPKYGFPGTLYGVKEAAEAMEAYRDNDDIDRVLRSIEVMLGVSSNVETPPLTKEQVLPAVKEFAEGFSSVEFQDRLTALEIAHEGDLQGFRKARMEHALRVQRKTLIKYGLPGNLTGLLSFKKACAPLRKDEDVDREITHIEQLLRVRPARVVLSRQQAVAVIGELLDGYSTGEFQDALSDIEREFRGTVALQYARMKLALSVQRVVIAKYGLPGNMEGVLAMDSAVAAFHGDEEVDCLLASVETMLRLNPREVALSRHHMISRLNR
eukprot:TRINITY_DN11465_c0_g1_i3.p1 TRINITY_DN11465_c0_g1~~TRINITY_DN11465_c0_g1_i3.p1  ORF type:complete len:362 (-),score=51.62 TRINITY_DN11465_c0_g1_i3:79-1164(-)